MFGACFVTDYGYYMLAGFIIAGLLSGYISFLLIRKLIKTKKDSLLIPIILLGIVFLISAIFILNFKQLAWMSTCIASV